MQRTDPIKTADYLRMCEARDYAIKRFAGLQNQVHRVNAALTAAGLAHFGHYCTGIGERESILFHSDSAETFRKRIDRSAWQQLMNESHIAVAMDRKAHAEFHAQLNDRDGTVPEFTPENVETTFKQLHDNRHDIFERGVINVFKARSWDYKSNSPRCFGSRHIIKCHDRYPSTWSLNHHHALIIDDITRLFFLMEGEPLPAPGNTLSRQFSSARHRQHHSDAELTMRHADQYIEYRWFNNGNIHLHFLRPDLVEKLNKIVAKHYPGMLWDSTRENAAAYRSKTR